MSGYFILGIVIFILLLIGGIVCLSCVVKGLAETNKKQKAIIKSNETIIKKYEKLFEELNKIDNKKNNEVKNLNETSNDLLINRANKLF